MVKMIKEILLEQFNACYDENVWFVALKNALEGITATEAVWSPKDSDKNIWKLLTHLNFYNEAWLIRFGGGEFKYPEGMDNDDTFSVSDSPDDAALKTELDQMNEVMNGWRTALQNSDEAKFSRSVSETNESKWFSVISNINTHNAYHAGQILLLRKLHGTWNAEKGVS